jgi:hypothetical protein
MSNKKGFVRYANNKLVAGSLILADKAPKVGVWKEIAYDLCCGGGNNCKCTDTTNTLSFTLTVPPSLYNGIVIEALSVGQITFISGADMGNWVNDNGGGIDALVEFLNLFYGIFGTWTSSEEGEYGTIILQMNSCLFSIYGETTSLTFLTVL